MHDVVRPCCSRLAGVRSTHTQSGVHWYQMWCAGQLINLTHLHFAADVDPSAQRTPPHAGHDRPTIGQATSTGLYCAHCVIGWLGRCVGDIALAPMPQPLRNKMHDKLMRTAQTQKRVQQHASVYSSLGVSPLSFTDTCDQPVVPNQHRYHSQVDGSAQNVTFSDVQACGPSP
jgi:hypothetical protein